MTTIRKYIPVLFGDNGGGDEAPTYGDITPAIDEWVKGYYYGENPIGVYHYYTNAAYSNTPNLRANAGDILVFINNPSTSTTDLCCFSEKQTDVTEDLPFYRIRIGTKDGARYECVLPEGTKYFTLTKQYTKTGDITVTLTKGE